MKPVPTSVWFSKNMIHNMVTLLSTEKAPGGQKADGVRIYFAYVNGQNTILLVSTYAYDHDNVPSKTKHQDYFDHDVDKDLFKNSGNIAGEVCHDYSPNNLCDNGAQLFQNCPTPCPVDANCNTGNLHYITRKYGQSMVWNFGTDTIQTKSEWFDLDLFEQIDAENDYDGVRIYFGKHSDSDLIFPNKDVFVIVTTKTGLVADTHIDNFNCKLGYKYFKKFKNINELLKYYLPDSKNKSKKYLAKKLAELKIWMLLNGQDNGELCPSHCDGTTNP
jgi:hypothetical protein